MESMVRKGFLQAREKNKICLFKSYNGKYNDGDQERDFLYIKDAVKMTLFFLDHPDINGIFNVGSGQARNWNDLAQNIFKAIGREPTIEYIPMPEAIISQYQYHTCAEIKKIRSFGYTQTIMSLEESVLDYIENYLVPNRRLAS